MDADIAGYRDQSAVLTRLAAALPAALAVRDYWDAADGTSLPRQDSE